MPHLWASQSFRPTTRPGFLQESGKGNMNYEPAKPNAAMQQSECRDRPEMAIRQSTAEVTAGGMAGGEAEVEEKYPREDRR